MNHTIFQNAKESSFGETYFSRFSQFDTVLDVFAYQPIVLGRDLPPAQMALYRNYIASLFYALMKAKRFLQIRVPTAANAEESNLEPGDYIRRMEAAYDIDYDSLRAACVGTLQSLGSGTQYLLKTGDDCELFFDLTGRKWHIDAGDGDWPCGEIYIAPQENEINGRVFFERLYIEDHGAWDNVTLTVRDGRIVASDREEVTAFFMGLAPENRLVCELGLGMNPNVTDVCGYTILDEKMAGSFHIAIGANTMFGGQNDAKMHMDFVSSGSFGLLPVKEGE